MTYLWKVTHSTFDDTMWLERVSAWNMTPHTFVNEQGRREKLITPNKHYFNDKEDAVAHIINRLEWLEADYSKKLDNIKERIVNARNLLK